MVKKINFLLVLLLLLITIGAVNATDDFNETVGISNEATDELSISDNIASADTINDEVLTETSHTVNEENYNTYFNSAGKLISSSVKDGDTITIEGTFNKKNFTFEKPINVVGSNSNLKNCVFTLNSGASGSNLSNLNIANTVIYNYGIFLNGASNCLITGCTIKNTGASSYPICIANDANYNNITYNKLTTYGQTYGHGTRSTPPLIISGAHYNYIASNDIDCDDADAIYLSSFAGGPLKGGDSKFNVIYNNTIKYNVLPTSWAYGIQVMGRNNTIDSNKIIGAYLGISAGVNAIVTNNQIINVTGADFNHVGVESGGEGAIAASLNSLVKNNIITGAKIISTGAGISVSDRCVVEDNYVQVLLSGVGIKPQGSHVMIKNNTVITTTGHAISTSNSQLFNLSIIDNDITSQSGIGVLIQKISSKRMSGNITIINNVISTNNQYSINAKDVNASTAWTIEKNKISNKNSRILTPEGEFDPSKHAYNFKGKTYMITPSNYGDYIDENGGLTSAVDDGDILSFSGEFSNKFIYVNKAIKITGDNPTFYNTTFRVSSDGVWIENLNIKNNRAERINAWGVLVYQVTGVTILNCTIDVYDPNAAYAIYVVESNEVDVINNTLSSEGNYLTYTILAHTVTDCRFINNVIFTNGTGQVYTFENQHCLEGNTVCTDGSTVCTDGNSVCTDGSTVCTDGNSVCTDGSTVCTDGNSVCTDGSTVCTDGSSVCADGNSVCPDGSSNLGSHVLKEVYRTYGILIVYSSENVVSQNKVRVTSKLNQTYSTFNSTNSIVGIDLYYNSHNNVFSDNEVYVWGNDNYIYGMGVLGYYTTMYAPEGQGAENNQFINNNIAVEGSYCVEGLIIGSSSENTIITGNVIDAKSSEISYGINLEMSQKSDIKYNSFTLNSDLVYGLEAFDSDNNIIKNNSFDVITKQAYGFVISNSDNNEINLNCIFLNIAGDNVGFKNFDTIEGGDAGIYLRSYSTNNSIVDNNITTLKGYAIIIDNDAKDNNISNNYLYSANGTGNDAVNSTANNVVSDNYANLVTGKFDAIVIKYLENGTFTFTTSDKNMEGAIVEFSLMGEKVGSSVINNGIAKFDYEFKDSPADYLISAKVTKDNYKVTEFESSLSILKGNLIIVIDDVTGPIARSAQFSAIIKDILGNPVSGMVVEFTVIDDGYPAYLGKATSDENGLAVLNAEIPQIYGENPTISADVNGNYEFESANATSKLNAYNLISTSILINSKVYPKGVLAILKDQNGSVLANKKLRLMIGNADYNLTTNKLGQVILPTLSRGSYTVYASFAGDEDFYSSKNTVKVNVMPAIIGNKNYVVYYGNAITYKLRIIGADGKYVGAGKVVSIKVNGKTYSVKTNKYGYVLKSFKLNPGIYTLTAQYNGDKVSSKILFKPTVITKNMIVKKAKIIKFSAKLVNKYGKILKNQRIIFKVNGKAYIAKTNKYGVAIISIKNLKVGKSAVLSTYGGCKVYNTITVKK
ncbi:right-handed parallel beta-helix repeat-containing protein [uncultured Methanobrevibacter sp.]|uniref:right-handed parallel beta-helix repeat-containing protein n=1 Tax=uncultured Methanobrevibacter sp. TaxID=253161 RepID=UPI0025CE2079|nr:right-handed parallel beta-helix repeat-containing protein [uncultured Methanobrevibacter sp.]